MDNSVKKSVDHSGHRQRVKDAVKDNGFGHLADKRLLELLLFYSIPRKETYDIAETLIAEFGTLNNVFSADFNSLCKVDGVGESTALMLAAMGETFRRISMPGVDKRISLKTVDDFKNLAKSSLVGRTYENVILVCLDNAKRVKKISYISEGEKNTTYIDVKKAVQVAIDCEATSVFLAHNHPETSSQPSAADIDSTRSLCVMFRKLGIHLIDHIIVGVDDVYSMHSDPSFTQLFY